MPPVEQQTSAPDIVELLRQAAAFHQRGVLDQAEPLYRQALAVAPDNFDALHLCGVLLHQRGRPAEALALIGRALKINGQVAHAHSHYGLVLSVLERDQEAIESFDRAIAIAPDFAAAFNNRGNVLRKLGRAEEALASFEHALRIRHAYPEALNNRGNALAALGRLVEALASYDRALEERPDYADAYINRAEALRRLDRREQALASLDRALAIEPTHRTALKARARLHYLNEAGDAALADYTRLLTLNPDDAEGRLERGNIFFGRERFVEALADYEHAVVLNPDFAPGHNNRGNTLRALGRFTEAVAAFDRALALRPDYAEAFNNRGIALVELGRIADAVANYDRALMLKPDFTFAHVNRGTALRYLGRTAEAIASFDQAIALSPELADAHWNRALLFLSAGDFERGLPGYEWRWRRGVEHPRDFSQPLWRGENLSGKTILLHAEQGFGDSIQMLRYLPSVAAQARHVVLELPDALIPLIAPAANITLLSRGARLPAFDVHCPLMSLLLAFSTRLDTIPAPVPYLHVPPARLTEWRSRFAGMEMPHTGLVWSGKPSHKNDHNRSIPLARLGPLLSVPGVRFVSLQREYRATDLPFLAQAPITRLDDRLTDFADAAAAICQLDLTIAVDTAVAHLAGALGKPVWILISHIQDWRWFTGREDSPWYPTARLFRQAGTEDWENVIARLAQAVAEFARGAARGRSAVDANFPPD